MHPFVMIPLAACIQAVMIGSAIASSDPGQRANRLTAMMLGCSAWWSLCEVLWNLQTTPEMASWLIKVSSLGWLPLGALCFDLFAEIQGDPRSRFRRLIPVAYASVGVSMILYIATPYCLAGVVRTSWGWAYRFGPLFPIVYMLTAVWVMPLAISWRRLFAGSPTRERNESNWLFAGILASVTVISVTDVLFPYLGKPFPRLGSASLLAIGLAVGWSVRKHGYFLLVPGAFAGEIIESLEDGVAMLHTDGRIRTCNQGLARLAGRPAESLIGTHIRELLPELGDPQAEGLQARELQLQPREGEPIPVSVSSSLLPGSVRSPDPGPIGTVLAIQDLREVTTLRGRLVTSGRLAAVGELAAGIAHEIASPVTYVRASLVQMRLHWERITAAADGEGEKLGIDELLAEGGELIDESIEGIERVGSIVRNVGTFSHAGRGKAEAVDVNRLLDEAVGVAVLSFSVVVERCYGAVPLVHADPQQLKQVFLNLLLNALQAMGDYGRIRLLTQRHGDSVVISIDDDGPGIAQNTLDRVFDPFFTTRPAGQGLGLGLAHCYQIVRNLGGEIGAESTPGMGATFEVRLPVAN